MKPDITESPNETPIICVLITLGFLSFLATFPVIGLQNPSFNAVIVAGLICGICALPLGLKLGDTRSEEERISAQCPC